MADIRCPMCGKPASDDLDICPFCQARLKPMIIPSPGNDQSIPLGDEVGKEDSSDHGLEYSSKSSPLKEESIRPGEAPTKKNTDELENKLPSWLQKLRGQTNEKSTADEPVESEESLGEIKEISEIPDYSGTQENTNVEFLENPDEEGSDWLSGLEQTAQEKDELPAWVSNIKDIPHKEQSVSDPAGHNPPKDQDNWMDLFRDESLDQDLEPEKEKAETQQEDPVLEESVPDWMKKLQDEVDAHTEASGQNEENQQELGYEDSPDWLNRLQTETQENAMSNEIGSAGHADETTDWLDKGDVELPLIYDENTSSDSETPDWLRNLQLETQAYSEDLQSTETESQDIEQNTPPTVIETLSSLKDLESNSPTSSEEFRSSKSETQDWLKSMGSELQDNAETEGEDNATGELADIQSDLPLHASEDLDELITNDNEANMQTGQNIEDEFSQQEVDENLFTEVEKNQRQNSEIMPDWLKNIDKSDSNSSDSSDQSLDEHISDNVSEDLLFAELTELSKNLNSENSVSPSEETELIIEPEADELLPAELPSWVQAMRPVESMVADVRFTDEHLEQITEKAGPLAGLHGVLPTTPGFGKLRKPLNYSVKLRMSEEQSIQADLLKQMMGVESQAQSSTLKGKKFPKRFLRWIVATLVFVAVVSPIFTRNQVFSAPSIYPPELVAAREILFGLPQASPVLLVFDYEPAYSGELEVTAAPMVDNLIFSGARLAILSTSPTGPILAEHFLKTTQAQIGSQSDQHYANLGYLAGGASGVLSFALNPSKTLPFAMDGSIPWQTPLLQDIDALSDFKAVLVLTDNPDSARIWVEQVSAILGDTPLLMAISAQAEPMIRPYYDSMQIKGLVTGLAGGKAYEQALQFTGLGQKYWNSFSSGLFIAELIVIFGSLWSIVSVLRNRKPVLEEEA